ncbi:hypothetical protein EHR05_14745 [Leptospira licerasiae]|nr:hypothetical protein EHR05_14745 [Leptospira licerasiae]
MNELSAQSCFDKEYLFSFLKTEKRIPLLLHKHLNHCQNCQSVIMQYSETEDISEVVFGREIQELKALWYGSEIHNIDWIDIQSESNKESVFNRMFQWFLKYKKRFLLIGYFAIIYNLIILFKRSFY